MSEQQAPREYSLIELDNAVNSGTITQLQRDQILQTQNDNKVRIAIQEGVKSQIEVVQRDSVVLSELDQYKAAAPELAKEGSPLRERAREEYDYLVERGAPENHTTELAAARAVLGDLNRVKSGRRVGADRFADTMGGNMSPAERRQEDAFSKLSSSEQAHYSKMIQNGVYKDKAAVLAERNWTRGSKQNERGRA